MRVFLAYLFLLPAVVLAITQQEPDERPTMRRKPRPEPEFKATYAEGTIFNPITKTLSGTLKHVDCAGKTPHIQILADNKRVTFEITDPKLIEIKGTGSKEFDFTCGPQSPRPVIIEYVEAKSIKSIRTLDFNRESVKDSP